MKSVPKGEWHCPICAKDKQIPRRARTKRVMKRTAPEKLIMPEYTKSTKKENVLLAHDDSPDEQKSSSSRRPLVVRLKLPSSALKLGHSDKTGDRKLDESNSSNSGMIKQKLKVDANCDKKSTGDDKSPDMQKVSCSPHPILVRLKLGQAEKSEGKLKTDDDNDSGKKSTGDACKKNQEVAIILIY
jgi:hypothetical protein